MIYPTITVRIEMVDSLGGVQVTEVISASKAMERIEADLVATFERAISMLRAHVAEIERQHPALCRPDPGA